MNRGLSDEYIQNLLNRGAAYVNRQFISFAPDSATEAQIGYTCEMLAEFIKAAYNGDEINE